MSTNGYILVEQSLNLSGTIDLVGAKNAVLPMMAALILAEGESVLYSVPNSSDVKEMINLLISLGAQINYNSVLKILRVNTQTIDKVEVKSEIMDKMRASILVMGPLLARFKRARVALPGGCLIGARPIDFHLKGLANLGVVIKQDKKYFNSFIGRNENLDRKLVLEYPSVGATENLVMFATMQKGTTTIINVALEPEVLDFIELLKRMGAKIEFNIPSTLIITGVDELKPVKYKVVPDRLEAGALLLAAAITGGQINLPDAIPGHMDIFLEKLEQMGHKIEIGFNNNDGVRKGIRLISTPNPKAVDIKTYPYPGFPTDLQAPMMAALCLAQGKSKMEETVFENRLMHVKELEKMGAQIKTKSSKAIVAGVDQLYGAHVIASDIRASAALVIAGLAAEGETQIFGIHHWRRGYDFLEKKLQKIGAKIKVIES